MLKRKTIDPLVIGFVVAILVVATLMLSGSANAEYKSVSKDVNYDYVHDEYDQNINSCDEYSYEECNNEESNENQIWNELSI